MERICLPLAKHRPRSAKRWLTNKRARRRLGDRRTEACHEQQASPAALLRRRTAQEAPQLLREGSLSRSAGAPLARSRSLHQCRHAAGSDICGSPRCCGPQGCRASGASGGARSGPAKQRDSSPAAGSGAPERANSTPQKCTSATRATESSGTAGWPRAAGVSEKPTSAGSTASWCTATSRRKRHASAWSTPTSIQVRSRAMASKYCAHLSAEPAAITLMVIPSQMPDLGRPARLCCER